MRSEQQQASNGSAAPPSPPAPPVRLADRLEGTSEAASAPAGNGRPPTSSSSEGVVPSAGRGSNGNGSSGSGSDGDDQESESERTGSTSTRIGNGNPPSSSSPPPRAAAAPTTSPPGNPFGFVKPLFQSPSPPLAAAYRSRNESYIRWQAKVESVSEARRRLDDAIASERAAKRTLASSTRDVFASELTEPYCTWNANFAALKRYVDANGHCRLPCKNTCGTDVAGQRMKKLSIWLGRQKRTHSKLVKRAPHRVKALESLGVTWTDSYDDRWAARARQLVEYRRRHGTTRVPRAHDSELHYWVQNQRSMYHKYRAGQKTMMTEERIRHLESMGFEWANKRDKDEQQWDDMLEKLREYRETNGHVNLPSKARLKDGPGADVELLGLKVWLQKQKNYYTRGLGSSEKVDALRKLGVEMHRGKTEKFALRLRELVEYRALHGHCRVPERPRTTLSNWVRRVRKNYKLGTLPGEQVDMIEEARIDFEDRDGGGGGGAAAAAADAAADTDADASDFE